MVFVVYRQAIATLVLFPASILLKGGKMDHLALGVKGFSLVFLTALIGPTLSQYFVLQGLDMTSVSVATAMVNLVPAMTFFMTVFLGLEKNRVLLFGKSDQEFNSLLVYLQEFLVLVLHFIYKHGFTSEVWLVLLL
ncbi:hypothetical protein J5N97_026858 [Dioscorea zingiberensis]|uniref:WAT1-related protein n=1 Tax=Dioscorea zingiberensis TaxID=325984 RepID=A0A9D5C349_9LILI|nr:hypothetical protein J5N97_026858 [Dioscorea zingiberensis]